MQKIEITTEEAGALSKAILHGNTNGLEELANKLESLISEATTIMKYVIVRTISAGVFAGELESREGREVTLVNVRRLWYWAGAASLSELAQRGTSRPGDCKFPVAVDRITLLEAIEILDVTASAQTNIESVPVWTR